ncbi:MAG: sugar ABC transporter permease, partial [Spirochaetaceae bacterium]|nr:sugar ABC transporter permease [Spirochaetaceae bacterium]
RKGEIIGVTNYAKALGFAEAQRDALWLLLLVGGIAAMVAAGIFLGRVRERARSSGSRRRTSDTTLRVLGWLVVVAGMAAIAIALPQIWSLGDDKMLKSLRITISYAVGTVPIQLVFGLLLAVLLDQNFKGRQFFRVVFLLPYIVPTVASAAIFQVLLSLRPESFANQLIGLFGAEPLGWLGERHGVFEMFFNWGTGEAATTFAEYWQEWIQGPPLALVSIMIFNYWVFIGYYALIYSNGLSNIPKQLYEAAEVDGAPRRTVLFRIIIPLLSPTTFFLTLLGVIGTLKAFSHIYVLRNPATGGATDTMSIYVFFTFFRGGRFGYAAAMALLLFALVLGLTFLQRRLMERRIHYGD